ncbi:MAG: sulfatase-like hydrolase/transferase, partial [Acidobacteria bacterium]|nr:sulfatase-like hydrolase/transferase [Acidobacteriota bacterium]
MIIILITLDCVRKDHFNRDLMPNFFLNEKDWVSFENAFSQSQNTLSSHFTMFTSNYLFQHGVYSNFSNNKLPDYSIDKLLRKNGFETKGICGISFLSNQLGNKIGEEDSLFSFSSSKIKMIKQKIFGERRRARSVVSKGLKWLLDKKRKEKKFLWLHFFDAHMPYYCPHGFFEGQKVKMKKSVKEQIEERGWFSP